LEKKTTFVEIPEKSLESLVHPAGLEVRWDLPDLVDQRDRTRPAVPADLEDQRDRARPAVPADLEDQRDRARPAVPADLEC